ncbi:MAG TPA: hypothetical protein PK992_05210 [Planctomycetaceae bacterium]|nr:hypothetical protein [Planctomycetaceae bacterium]
MKIFTTSLMTLALASVSGCSEGTPGGPGATVQTESGTKVTANKPMFGQTENTFNLDVPMMSSALQQGHDSEATVGIKRALNFDEDVTLSFSDVPKGVTVEPASPVIKHGDKDATIHFKATDKALIGDYKIKVTGHPEVGADAAIEFKLNVTAKETFSVSVPRLSTSLKQGETQTVSIGVSRDKNFTEDVTLTFGKLPEGVTISPESAVLTSDTSESVFTLTGAEDASLGNFTVDVKGHPAKGAETSSVLKLAVTEK